MVSERQGGDGELGSLRKRLTVGQGGCGGRRARVDIRRVLVTSGVMGKWGRAENRGSWTEGATWWVM